MSAPIPLKPDFQASQANAVSALTRAVIAIASNRLDQTVAASDYARATWGSNRTVESILRAASSAATTTTTGWATELSHITTAFLASLVPQSAGADLLGRALQLRFDGNRTINLPSISQGQATFVGELKPIPVAQFLTASGVTLQPHKLALISVLTREMIEASNAEPIIRTALSEAASLGLDAALFSANAATPDAPAGLLNGITPITASTASPVTDAMTADLAALAGAIARVAGSNIIFVTAPEQAIPIMFWSPEFPIPVLTSKALPKGTIIAVSSNALVSGYDPVPEIIASKQAELMMDTAPIDPLPLGTAGPIISLFQGDKVALKLRMPLAWALRAPSAIAFVQSVVW
jgi:hypothetical protein